MVRLVSGQGTAPAWVESRADSITVSQAYSNILEGKTANLEWILSDLDSLRSHEVPNRFPSEVWNQAVISNMSSNDQKILFVGSYFVSARVHLIQGDSIRSISMGTGHKSVYHDNHVTLSYTLPARTSVRLLTRQELRYAGQGKLRFYVMTPEDFYLIQHDYIESRAGAYTVLMVLTGGILFMGVYFFIQFGFYRDPAYLFYALHLFFTSINLILVGDRLHNSIKFAIYEDSNYLLEIAYIGSFAAYASFVYYVMKEYMKVKTKNILRVYIGLLLGYILCYSVFYFGDVFYTSQMLWFMGIPFRVGILGFGFFILFILYRQNRRAYINYMIAGTVVLMLGYLSHVVVHQIRGFSIYNHYLNLFGCLIEVMLFTHALSIRKRNLEIEKELLNESNKLKSRFFANISHEFRTPLTLIKSPIQYLREYYDERHAEQIDLIDRNADRMLELVDQLLELSQIDQDKLRVTLRRGDLQSHLRSLLESFQYKAKSDKLDFDLEIELGSDPVYFDRDILDKIVANLVSNAFKYHARNTAITFKAYSIDGQLRMEVSNYTEGLQTNELKKFFERFYQRNQKSKGAGIGLSLVKELVELYSGSLKTSLKEGRLTLSVELPLDQGIEDAIVVGEASEGSIEGDFQQEILDKRIILVVDDNKDIRKILVQLFREEFSVLQAGDGRKALELAKTFVPDVIISDVMMPEMDGMELTRRIKGSEVTSFIPILLLTAKSSEVTHLKALDIQADGYLTKPFNHSILKSKINTILENRKRLSERIRKEIVAESLQVTVESAEQQFLKRLKRVLEGSLNRQDFTVAVFAEEMGLSRMQLHRKMKSVFGTTASDFIRNERLKLAAEMLVEPGVQVSTVAYNSGFNDPNYFSKCFREYYGVTPTQYISLQSKEG